MSTETEDRREVTITAVFANYRDTVQIPGTEQRRAITRSARRGETVSIPASEAARLESLGAVGTADQVQAIIDRALNPTDNRAEGAAPTPGSPVDVSPPSLGVAPVGDLTTGDTGGDDVQPVTTTSGAAGEVVTFDARAADVDQAVSWLQSERPTAPQVVEAAHGDGDAAATLLEAEQVASNGDPRKTVVQGLEAIIDGDDGSGS